jgi:hypothetical protein
MTVHGLLERGRGQHPRRRGRPEGDTAKFRQLSHGAIPPTLNQADGDGSWRRPPELHPRNVDGILKCRDFH